MKQLPRERAVLVASPATGSGKSAYTEETEPAD